MLDITEIKICSIPLSIYFNVNKIGIQIIPVDTIVCKRFMNWPLVKKLRLKIKQGIIKATNSANRVEIAAPDAPYFGINKKFIIILKHAAVIYVNKENFSLLMAGKTCAERRLEIEIKMIIGETILIG